MDKARFLAPQFVSYRMEYATRKRSPYGTVNEFTQGFMRVGASEMMRPVVKSSQEVSCTELSDGVYRQDKCVEGDSGP